MNMGDIRVYQSDLSYGVFESTHHALPVNKRENTLLHVEYPAIRSTDTHVMTRILLQYDPDNVREEK